MTAAEASIAANRRRKAQALARHILKHTIAVARELTPEQWEHAANASGVKPPSADTVAEVLRILEEVAI